MATQNTVCSDVGAGAVTPADDEVISPTVSNESAATVVNQTIPEVAKTLAEGVSVKVAKADRAIEASSAGEVAMEGAAVAWKASPAITTDVTVAAATSDNNFASIMKSPSDVVAGVGVVECLSSGVSQVAETHSTYRSEGFNSSSSTRKCERGWG